MQRQDTIVAMRRTESQCTERRTDLFALLSPDICIWGKANQKMAPKCRISTQSLHVTKRTWVFFFLLQLLPISFFLGRAGDFNQEKHKYLRRLKKFHQKIFL